MTRLAYILDRIKYNGLQTIGKQVLHQRGFAHLPRAQNNHNGKMTKSIQNHFFQQSWIINLIHNRKNRTRSPVYQDLRMAQEV